MGSNPFRWIEIYVDDMPRAKKFYEQFLQLSLQKLDPPPGMNCELYAFPMSMDGTGASGALVKMEGVSAGRNSVIPYFSSADCSVEAERASKVGGTLFKDKFSIGQYGYIALVTDTEGNMIGVHSIE